MSAVHHRHWLSVPSGIGDRGLGASYCASEDYSKSFATNTPPSQVRLQSRCLPIFRAPSRKHHGLSHFYLESLGMQQGADEILDRLQAPSALLYLTEPGLKKFMQVLSNMQVFSI
ncbi:hypothetical protein QMK61_03960 [Fulvimonas sp. R45]|uniref:hypothetical protein n=1 Tax=Fulvimonas sp. R45 TaxID=3045937 RepID=UPI00265DAE51|nr:hypothetical protein [Fulvimonas sp. R45]MDO1527980.1 hypothetical protein [Fulvimonas sp. R45]